MTRPAHPAGPSASSRSFLVRLAAALLATAAASCGGGAQGRPDVVATFPADGQVLPGSLSHVRITYDEPVEVLNVRGARLDADGPDGGGQAVRLWADPTDDHSILIQPDRAGHFVANAENEVIVLEGAVRNRDGHYRLDEYRFRFTLGPAPDLFLSAADGSVREVDPGTGATVATTSPGAGFSAREPFGTDGRLWVWRDPVPGPGSSLLSTFLPGDATITQDVAITGETGTVTGGGFAVSLDRRTLYATARDAGTDRLFVHRIDVATQTETGSIALSVPLAGNPSFRPCVDLEQDRLMVSVSDGAGGGWLAVVDLGPFAERDMDPAPGVNALPVPGGAGDVVYDEPNDFVWMLDQAEANAAFVLFNANTFAQYPTEEPEILGTPSAALPTPDGLAFVQGLDGYVGTQGLVRSASGEVGEGFAYAISDDVGGVAQGCFRVRALLRDPVSVRFYAFPDDGAGSFLALYDTDDGDLVQVDLDAVTAGIQVIDLGFAVTGATTLTGATPP